MTNLGKVFVITALFALLLAMTVQTVTATPLTFNITDANTALESAGYADGTLFGTVTLTLTSTNTVEVVLERADIFLFGDGATLALNLKSTATNVGNSWLFQGGNGKWANGAFPKVNAGSCNVSELGCFNYVIDGFDGLNAALTKLTFTLTKSSGTWSDESDVLQTNSDNFSVAGHVYVGSGANTGVTGFAGDAQIPVSEPATLLGLGFALVGLGFVRRKLGI